MPFHSDLFAASTVSTVQWSGWKLFNLISAAEKWAENKNFKVHKFMRKISCCSHFFFFFTVINYTFLSESLLDCHRAKVMLLRTTTACISGDDSVNQQSANIISQIWKSKFLFIFSLRWLSLQRTRNFHIFLKKKKKRIDIEGRRRRNVNSCSKSSTFRCSLFFSSSKKVLAERIRDGGIHYNIFKEGWKCLWGSFLCSRAEFTASRSNDNGVCIFMIECWQARVIGWCQQHQFAFHKVNQSDFNEIFISIVTHDFCRLRI